MSQKVGVVRFPGTNCDRDVFGFVEAKGYQANYLWHLDQFPIEEYDSLIIPGGFSYGDYLRSGALSARSPVMSSVRKFVDRGGPVLGICNGFQILTESGLLPGALVKNIGMNFIDDWVDLKVENQNPYWARSATKTLRLPVAHGDGRFYAPEADLKRIQDQGLVWLRYNANPNGSLQDIAGVTNASKKVAGLMPHPERAIFDWMGGTDGWEFLA
jgi:phosphoribosylformylglycinamidine synthase subunit PurQ / glutaminase